MTVLDRRLLRAVSGLAVLLLIVVTWIASSSAQDGGGPDGASPVDAAVAGEGQTTIQIDPSATEAISLEASGDESADPGEADEEGPIRQALENAVPDTGNAAVDTSVNKLAESIGGLVDGFIEMLPQLLIALIVLVFTAIAATLVGGIVRRVSRRARLRGSLVDLFVIFARVGVWFIGLMTAAGIVFPSFGFGQLVATAGLASIAIGLAFQDIFENFFAGILILWRFPFENGDFIEVDGIQGMVEDVEIRMTRIRKTSGDLVLVPNSTVFKGNVIVYTNRPRRRIELAVGIAYGEDVGEGRRVILEAVKSCDTVQQDPAPEVLAVAFGASSIDFDVLWYTGSTPIEERRSRDQVVEAVKRALDDAGIEIPYPYRTLTFSKHEPDIIEAVAGRLGNGRASGQGGGKR